MHRPAVVGSWDPPKNSRFELFSFHANTAKHFGSDKEVNELFGVISVSNKYGLVSGVESYFFEPDFAHVPLFNRKWCNPINPGLRGIVYVGSSSRHSAISFSSSIEIISELYIVKDKDYGCYQFCNHKIEIDLSDFFWDKKSDSACGELFLSTEDGSTAM